MEFEQQLTSAVNRYCKIVTLKVDPALQEVRVGLRYATVINLAVRDRRIHSSTRLLGQPLFLVAFGIIVLGLSAMFILMSALGPTSGLARIMGSLCLLPVGLCLAHVGKTLRARDAAKGTLWRNWVASRDELTAAHAYSFNGPRPLFVVITQILTSIAVIFLARLYEQARSTDDSMHLDLSTK